MSLFDWNEYLALAEAMHRTPGPSEAQLRCAISRAYYGAYNQAKRRFLDEGNKFKYSGDQHAQVWQFFTKNSDPNYRQIGIYGDRARRHRVLADYEDEFPTLALDVGVSLNEAREVVRRLAVNPHPVGP